MSGEVAALIAALEAFVEPGRLWHARN